jgi:uncharacterized membrane protein (DUF485 family)
MGSDSADVQLPAPPPATDPTLAHVLKFPITIIMMVVALPAGLLPFFVIGIYGDWDRARHVTTKWRSEPQIAATQHALLVAIGCLLASWIIHGVLLSLARRHWNRSLLGMRGAVWFVLLWGVFATGVGIGVLCMFLAPH